ncbi:MAG: DNA polymerase IV [Thermodesulfobacteriota bacterium]
MSRSIIHCDMDAFYASVEVLDNPALAGRPVVVGGSASRGVVSAASYEARRFGIHSAMPMAMAMKRCPEAVFLGVRMARYQEISGRIMAIFHRFTPLVEPLSLDEAFLDVTASSSLHGSGEEIAVAIRRLVREETGLTVSAGVAACKLVAKIASDQNKPDGLFIVPPGREREFLAPLPVGRLWGVGRAALKQLALMGVTTIGQLAELPEPLFIAKFGKSGSHMQQCALGIDTRPVEVEYEAQSIGNEETFDQDLHDLARLDRELLALCVRVARRLRQEGVAGRTVTVKVKYGDFVQVTRSLTLAEAIDDDASLLRTGRTLLKKTEAGSRPVRLLGISLSGLAPAGAGQQLALFNIDPAKERRRALCKAVDSIADRHGRKALLPGRLLEDG